MLVWGSEVVLAAVFVVVLHDMCDSMEEQDFVLVFADLVGMKTPYGLERHHLPTTHSAGAGDGAGPMRSQPRLVLYFIPNNDY